MFSFQAECVLVSRVLRQKGFVSEDVVTVAILAQGTSWAVAVTQAFYVAVRIQERLQRTAASLSMCLHCAA